MKKLTLLPLILILSISFTSASSWLHSLDQAKQLAKISNKLILVDFYADWCGPCKKMDRETWSAPDVKKQLDKLVAVKINVDYNNSVASLFGVKSIPSIFIIDAWGNVLYQEKGFKYKSFIIKLLSGFPNNTKEIYEKLKLLDEDKKNADLVTNVAISYQKTAINLTDKGQKLFLKASNSYFRTASKYQKKRKKKKLVERIQILKCYNDIIGKHPKSTIKKIEKIGVEKIENSNKDLALFVLVNGYSDLDDFVNANRYFGMLKQFSKNSPYIKELQEKYPDKFQ
jgi:thiol-disulfide isomerase/thioredoxin